MTKKPINTNSITDSYPDNLNSLSELNPAIKKCQSFMTMQKILFLKSNKKLNPKGYGGLSNNTLKKYDLDFDYTKKENSEFINRRLKNYFNLENYEQNIKNQAWKKDLSKMFLGLNNNNDNFDYVEKNDNDFGEYNFEKRENKKEGLIFLKNFFGRMKSIKKDKDKEYRKEKSKDNLLRLNKVGINFLHDNDKDKDKYIKKISDEELNLLFNRLKLRYSPQKSTDESGESRSEAKKIIYDSRTERNSKINFNTKAKHIIFKKKNNSNSKYHLNKIGIRLNTENNDIASNNSKSNKYLFPKIKNYSIEEKKTYNTNSENALKRITFKNKERSAPKNIKVNVSDNSIFTKNKNKEINRNKSYLEHLKEIYKSKKLKDIYKTVNNKENANKTNNFEIPKLIQYKEKPLIKKNNQLFFSALHYSKYQEMKGIRDKLIKNLDNEVFE